MFLKYHQIPAEENKPYRLYIQPLGQAVKTYARF